MTQELYVATLDTRHFSFAAHGASERAARAALSRGLKLHGVQYHVLPSAIRELMRDAEIRIVLMDECYRNNERLQVPAWL